MGTETIEKTEIITLQESEPLVSTPEGGPTKVTVKLSPKSVDALQHAAAVGELNRTDTTNRAIQLYDFIIGILAQDSKNVLIIERNGKQERVLLR